MKHTSARIPTSLALAAALTACGDDSVGTATDATTSATSTATATSSTDATTTTTTAGPASASGSDSDSDGTTTGDPTATSAPTTSETTTTANPTTTGDPTGDPTTDGTTDGTTTEDPLCPEGTILCEDNVKKVCDGMGGFSEETPCDDACAPDLGCVLCVPGEGVCEGEGLAKVCNAMGDGYEEETCDTVQGVVCDQDLGQCVGACAPGNLGTSYIGCDYYPLVTPNVVSDTFNFSVVVSNTSNDSAHVTVTRGAQMVTEVDVPSQSVQVVNLPWVSELKNASASTVVVDGAYRVRSDQPITLYQYNPLQYQLNNSFSFTNDASLLVPVNAWTGDYWVAIRNTLNGLPGIYAVVASEDDTTVDVTPSATGKIVSGGGGIANDGTGQAVLDQGDVLLVLSAAGGGMPDISDLTGTHVVADKPIQVISAHRCTYVPYDVLACDHLEESNLPYESLAKEYIVTTPLVKPQGQDPFIKARMVRVIATEDDTTITYDPPQGAPASLASAGDYFEIAATEADFRITADKKVVVSEYMQGQSAGGNTGDPAMTIAVPIEQYRTDYLFHAPTNYESSFVNITAPMGANVTLDGQNIPALTPIGGTGFGVARVEVSNQGDGTHALSGDDTFGVQVYGYGQYTSYWYPGGLDLKFIPQ
ncbi:MAG: IgGFc-binding protein [Nannocystaceae bacterium]